MAYHARPTCPSVAQYSFLGPLNQSVLWPTGRFTLSKPLAGGSGFGGHDEHPLPFLLVCKTGREAPSL